MAVVRKYQNGGISENPTKLAAEYEEFLAKKIQEEGNKFTKALDDARKDGDDTFEVDGEKYNVRKESRKSSLRLTLS